MLTVKILKNTVANRTTARIGEVVTVPDPDARYLVAIGKAEYCDTPAAGYLAAVATPEVPAVTPVEDVTFEEEIEPKKKRTKK
jgi:hypothetical protein